MSAWPSVRPGNIKVNSSLPSQTPCLSSPAISPEAWPGGSQPRCLHPGPACARPASNAAAAPPSNWLPALPVSRRPAPSPASRLAIGRASLSRRRRSGRRHFKSPCPPQLPSRRRGRSGRRRAGSEQPPPRERARCRDARGGGGAVAAGPSASLRRQELWMERKAEELSPSLKAHVLTLMLE